MVSRNDRALPVEDERWMNTRPMVARPHDHMRTYTRKAVVALASAIRAVMSPRLIERCTAVVVREVSAGPVEACSSNSDGGGGKGQSATVVVEPIEPAVMMAGGVPWAEEG